MADEQRPIPRTKKPRKEAPSPELQKRITPEASKTIQNTPVSRKPPTRPPAQTQQRPLTEQRAESSQTQRRSRPIPKRADTGEPSIIRLTRKPSRPEMEDPFESESEEIWNVIDNQTTGHSTGPSQHTTYRRSQSTQEPLAMPRPTRSRPEPQRTPLPEDEHGDPQVTLRLPENDPEPIRLRDHPSGPILPPLPDSVDDIDLTDEAYLDDWAIEPEHAGPRSRPTPRIIEREDIPIDFSRDFSDDPGQTLILPTEEPDLVPSTPKPGRFQALPEQQVPTEIEDPRPFSVPPTPKPADDTADPLSFAGTQDTRRARLIRPIATGLLLLLLIASLVRLVADLARPHLLLTSLDAVNGSVRSRMDLGEGYQGTTQLASPLQTQSALVVGLQRSGGSSQAEQQIFAFHGNQQVFQNSQQIATTSTAGNVSMLPDGRPLITNATGIKLINGDGKPIWNISGKLPTRGAHPYQPAIDQRNLYTVQSTDTHQIGAYSQETGQQLWLQSLDDTLDYTPPLQNNGSLIFVASDHNLYALKVGDGSISWHKTLPTRSLLLSDDGKQQLLISVGPRGLTALDSGTGKQVWSFDRAPDSQGGYLTTLTAPQLYQGALDSQAKTLYATGISWEQPQVRRQTWLYAFNASTGQPLWSKEVASDPAGAEASRSLTPLVDTTHKQVALQVQQMDGSQQIRAFGQQDGKLTWQTTLPAMTIAAPISLLNDGNLSLLGISNQTVDMKESWGIWRIGAVALIILSLLALGGLWSYTWIKRHGQKATTGRQPLQLRRRLYLFMPKVVAVILLLATLGTAVIAYLELNGTLNGDFASGLRDSAGNVFVVSQEQGLSILTATDNSGQIVWQNFSTEGQIVIPAQQKQRDSFLIQLSGRKIPQSDPVYSNPAEGINILYQIDRKTGIPQWQRSLADPDQQQKFTVLAADTDFIYLGNRNSPNSQVLLNAFYHTNGATAWQASITSQSQETGTLEIRGDHLIWHLPDGIYILDAVNGHIISQTRP